MNYKPVFYIMGILLLILSGAMIIPMAIDLVDKNPDWRVFAASQIITAFIGFSLIFVNREKTFRMTLRETFLMTTLSWIFMAVFGALPLCLADIGLSFSRGFFEAMSGVTTTGSTVITGLDTLPRGILIWRALLHWLGGIGILIIALAILPLLQISGMQIFKTQSQSFDTEKILPSASQTAFYILLVYAGLTAICTLLLNAAGMTFFEAVCHAMATLSTGGFSTSDQSTGYFKNPLIEWIMIYFMILGGTPFVLYLRMGRGDLAAALKDTQVQAYLGFIIFFALLLAAYLTFNGQFSLFDSLRHALFMVVTIMTTSGFATEDYTTWGEFAIGAAFLLTFIGGCSGSTSGGIKTFRFQILWSMLKLQINRLITPSGVFHVHYNNKTVDLTVQNAVGLFFFAYLGTVMVGGALLMLTGLDFVTAFSGSASAVSAVGPGLGDIIGPAGNFSTINPVALWILSVCMLLGRLEILTVLVLLTPRFWKH